MSSRIVLLGVGTCQLEPGRATSAALIELPDLRLVYDFGRGTAERLASLGLRQDDVEHIVLSHYHPDHVSDLIPYLQAAAHSRIDRRSRDLRIYGPPGLEEIVGGMIRLFGPGALVAEEAYAVHLESRQRGPLRLGSHELDYEELPPAGNHGLKLHLDGWSVALTGDSDFHSAEVDFLHGVDLAIFDAGHLSADEIVELAVRSEARRLVASHLYEPLDTAALTRRAAARGYRGRIEAGEDLMEIPLGG